MNQTIQWKNTAAPAPPLWFSSATACSSPPRILSAAMRYPLSRRPGAAQGPFRLRHRLRPQPQQPGRETGHGDGERTAGRRAQRPCAKL